MTKKILWILIIGVALCGAGVSAEAQRDDAFHADRTYAWTPWGGGGLQNEINHLNRMVGHVRWQLGRYHGDANIRRDFYGIRREVDHVNEVHRRGDYDHRQLRHEIERLHERLHDIEVRLRVRQYDYYHWR